MTPRLELWVEGPTDARTHTSWRSADEGDPPANDAGGALIPLVKKALSERIPEEQISAQLLRRKLLRHVRLGGRKAASSLSNRAWKMLAAIDSARSVPSPPLILVVVDRDGKDEPLQDRDRLHERLRDRGQKGAAIAVCVEAVEAWLLADPAAFARCFGRGPTQGLPGDPEREPDPKRTLMILLERLGEDAPDPALLYRRVAEHVDIEVLARRCPRGFGDLQRALRDLVEPCLESARRDD